MQLDRLTVSYNEGIECRFMRENFFNLTLCCFSSSQKNNLERGLEPSTCCHTSKDSDVVEVWMHTKTHKITICTYFMCLSVHEWAEFNQQVVYLMTAAHATLQ